MFMQSQNLHLASQVVVLTEIENDSLLLLRHKGLFYYYESFNFLK